jgi:hypothetical protein
MLGLDRLEDAAVRPSEVSDGPLGEVVVAFSGSGRNGLVVCPSWQLQNLLPQSVHCTAHRLLCLLKKLLSFGPQVEKEFKLTLVDR